MLVAVTPGTLLLLLLPPPLLLLDDPHPATATEARTATATEARGRIRRKPIRLSLPI